MSAWRVSSGSNSTGHFITSSIAATIGRQVTYLAGSDPRAWALTRAAGTEGGHGRLKERLSVSGDGANSRADA